MKWSYRSTLYKVALVFMYFIFLVFVLAFAVPTWYGPSSGSFAGLWLECIPASDDVDFDDCTTLKFEDSPDWMNGVRGVWAGGVFFYLLAVLVSFMENYCCSDKNKDHGVSCCFALLAGLCGAAGVILVAIKTADNDLLNHYRWGFFLACISSGLTIILAIMLFITRELTVINEKARQSRTADYVFAQKPYYPDYTNQGFQRDDMPLANGVTYHHSPHPYSSYRGGEQPPQTHPSAPYPGNSLQHSRGQAVGYNGGVGGGSGYQPFGYDMQRPSQRHSMAESADLSNGFTTELIHAEHSLSRTNHRGGDYGRTQDFAPRQQDYYMNGRY
ncbi:uncharacterized protein LOC101862247 [Aplysia californica]|uniref:Uncharacterized protein LOC101862247 n=1 Tax=Aplysia californica TaxID=6500 RepID=A0ABM1AG14_APLCA|nr:uncharacterized protein LOC101862247 [Aplysia californica]